MNKYFTCQEMAHFKSTVMSWGRWVSLKILSNSKHESISLWGMLWLVHLITVSGKAENARVPDYTFGKTRQADTCPVVVSEEF